MKRLLTKSAQELSASYANQNFAAKKNRAGGVCIMLEGTAEVLGIGLAKASCLAARRGDLVQFVGLAGAYAGFVIFWKGCMEL